MEGSQLVRELRHALGLSQKQLAHASGGRLEQASVSKIENGVRTANTPRVVGAYAAAAEVPIAQAIRYFAGEIKLRDLLKSRVTLELTNVETTTRSDEMADGNDKSAAVEYEHGVLVTPEVAKRWLGNNPSNRTINRLNVQLLTRQLVEGKWQASANTIKFSQSGTLIDGQHRLTAIAESGVSARCDVMRNAPTILATVIDTGRHRRLADMLRIGGYSSPTAVATIVSRVVWIALGRHGRTTESDARAIVRAIGSDVIDRAVELARAAQTQRFRQPLAFAAIVMSIGVKRPLIWKLAEETLTGGQPGSAAQQLRERLISSRTAPGGHEATMAIFSLMCSYLVAYAEGRSLTKLYDRPAVRAEIQAEVRTWMPIKVVG